MTLHTASLVHHLTFLLTFYLPENENNVNDLIPLLGIEILLPYFQRFKWVISKSGIFKVHVFVHDQKLWYKNMMTVWHKWHVRSIYNVFYMIQLALSLLTLRFFAVFNPAASHTLHIASLQYILQHDVIVKKINFI